MTNSLVIVIRNFKPPQNLLLKYGVEVKYRPSILDNVKHWKVLEDDEQIKRFIVVGEFANSTIDQGEKKEVDQEPT